MDLKTKRNFVRDFFKGKRPNLHPIEYLPAKVFFWYADTPHVYFDQHDKVKGKTVFHGRDQRT